MMRTILRTFVLLLLCVMPLASQSQAPTIYYADKAGSNANSCGTAATAGADRTKAKLTIAGLVACLNTNDIGVVGNGTYVESQITVTDNGATLKAENYRLAIISSISGCNPNISITANGVTIDGFDMRIDAANVYCTPNSAAGTAVRCWNGYTGCIVRNIKTDDPTGPSGKIRSHGVKTNQPNSLIEYNELAAGLETLAASNTIVRYNLITCCGGNWGHGMVNKGGSTGILIYDNIINATGITGWGILLGGSTDQSVVHTYECIDCKAYNNIVIVSTSGEAIGFQGCNGCAFHNNTTFNGDFSMNVGPSAGNNNNSWKNNLVDCGGSNATSNLSGTYTIDYNNFRNCTGVPSQAHAPTGDPLFVNAGSGNYALQAGSPAIDAGVNVGLPFNGGAPDLGAHETFGCAGGEVGLVDATSLILTCTNNGAPPLLPASSITGFTVTENGSPVTVSSAVRTGDNIIDLTLGTSITAGHTVLLSYSTSTGNVTNSALIGGTANQRLNAISSLAITNNVSAPPPTFTLTQSHFRCHRIAGAEEASPEVLTSTDTNCYALPGGSIRIRFKVTCTGADCGQRAFIPYYGRNGGGVSPAPSLFDAGNVKLYDTGEYLTPLNGAPTTELLTSDYPTNVPCGVMLTANAVPNLTLPQNSEAECEYAFTFDSDAVGGTDSYTFELREQNGSALTVSKRPTVSIIRKQASLGF